MIFHLLIWEQIGVQLWKFRLHILKKKCKVKEGQNENIHKVFQYADIIILRTNSFLLLKLDRLETASSFSLGGNKDDANDFSKAGTFQLDSAC